MDPYSNPLFLFCGRRCDRIKALHFEKVGFCLLYKRLDNGRFQWPRNSSEVRNLTRQEYRWLLEGLSIDQPKAIRPARKKDFWSLGKREKIFLPLMGQDRHCRWVLHMSMGLSGYQSDNSSHFLWILAILWKTWYFFWMAPCGNGMFSTFRFRQNDGAAPMENSLFCWISDIIGTNKRKVVLNAAVRNGSTHTASKRDNWIPPSAGG